MRVIAQEEARKYFDSLNHVRHEDVEEIVAVTVLKTLEGLGIDMKNPIQAQQNFANLREWSRMKQRIGEHMVSLFTKSIYLGIIALIVLGLNAYFNHGQKLPDIKLPE